MAKRFPNKKLIPNKTKVGGLFVGFPAGLLDPKTSRVELVDTALKAIEAVALDNPGAKRM